MLLSNSKLPAVKLMNYIIWKLFVFIISNKCKNYFKELISLVLFMLLYCGTITVMYCFSWHNAIIRIHKCVWICYKGG